MQVIRSNLLFLKDEANFRALISELRERGEVHSTALMEETFAIAMRQMIVGSRQIAEIPRLAAIVRLTGGDAEDFVNSVIVKAEAELAAKGS
jgi:hypothetical protein